MAVGYKEWFLVCKALGEGRQHVLLRKGGIAEGREGFAFKHDSFYLFPSYFHEQATRLRTSGGADMGGADVDSGIGLSDLHDPLAQEGTVVVRWFVRVDKTKILNSWAETVALEPFHIWKRELVRERFEYEGDSRLHCALVRVYKLPEPWCFPDHRSFGGCRSWLNLPDPPANHSSGMIPVIPEDQFTKVKQSVTELSRGHTSV